jgi:hypothetical protein
MAPLLAKPSPLNINLGSDRFSMFNKKAGHPPMTMGFSIDFYPRRETGVSVAGEIILLAVCLTRGC